MGALGALWHRLLCRFERRVKKFSSTGPPHGPAEMGFQPELGVEHHHRKWGRVVWHIDDTFDRPGNVSAGEARLHLPRLILSGAGDAGTGNLQFHARGKGNKRQPDRSQDTGTGVTFLFAAALTVWGAAGQVEIQAGLVMSLLQQDKIDFEPMIALQALFVLIFGALPFCAWLTMNAAVRIQPGIAPRHSFRAAIDDARDLGWPLL
jgi:hypothetical protein